MKRTIFTAAGVLLAPAAVGLTGCATVVGVVGGLRSDEPHMNRVDGLAQRVETVHVDVEIARQRARDALAALQVVAGADARIDPVVAYADFVASIESSEVQAEELRSSVEPMVDDAEEFFGEWGSDLRSFTSASMRNLSRARLAETQHRYRAIVQALGPAQTHLEELNLRLRDCATFLTYDFNLGAIDAIRKDVQELGELELRLDRRFEACLEATRDYVEATVMPAPVPVPTPE